jgi:methylglutaconyl-CoA hydratase
MNPSGLIYSTESAIALITLNRPDKKNALTPELINDLKQALREANNDDRLHVAVITGAGKDFCSGLDLSALQRISGSSILENLADAESLMELFLLIREMRIPVIAAVRGRALAGGAGLATACDVVLASSSARFGYPEVKIGFVPAIVMAILRRNVSEKRAFDLIVTGREIDAAEAERIGLINQVFPDDRFEQEIEGYLALYDKVSSPAVKLTKRLFYQTDSMSFEKAVQSGVDINTIARMTDDCRKRVSEFLSKK